MDFDKRHLGTAIDKINELLAMQDDLPKAVVSQLHKIRKILLWHMKYSTRRKPRRGKP